MKKKQSHSHSYHDHSSDLKRLNRARGQVQAIQRMIEDGRYCMDVIMQIRAARAALRSLESSILETHLRGCVTSAMKSKNSHEADIKISELIRLLGQVKD